MVRVYMTALEMGGYRVMDAANGQQALEVVRTRNPDVVILDLGLPDADGLDLIPQIRANTASPIIVVSARERETEKVRALDSGANDYLTKPFSVPELLARVRVALRGQAQLGGPSRSSISFGDCTLDLEARLLTRGGHPIRLSPTEFKLLATLARHADEVVTTNALLKEAWGAAYRAKHGYVRVYMHSLRRKLEMDPTRPRYLVNEAGLGYRLRTSF